MVIMIIIDNYFPDPRQLKATKADNDDVPTLTAAQMDAIRAQVGPKQQRVHSSNQGTVPATKTAPNAPVPVQNLLIPSQGLSYEQQARLARAKFVAEVQ